MKIKDNGILKIDTGVVGKKVAIFAGVHGNESPGIVALKRVIDEIKSEKIKIKSGLVYFVFGNPVAIEKNIRQIESNLNRNFLANNKGKNYEELRAKELMSILDEVDYLLDIHASGNKNSIPFVITEKNGFEVASKLDFNIIVENFDEYEPGATDGYMKQQDKVGLCLECGYLGDEKNADLAYKSILQFLKFYGLIDDSLVDYDNQNQKIIRVDGVIKADSDKFSVVRDFYDFEEVPAGTLIAKSDKLEYFTDRKRVILFGYKTKREIGEEAAILASLIKKK